MKKIFLLLVTMILRQAVFAQGETELEAIQVALQSSSAKELVKYCSINVEINIDGKENNYNKPQAEVVLRDFFKKNPASSFSYIHQGSSPEGLIYTIGRYELKEGAYRVVMFLKKDDDEYRIDTLTLSQE